MNLIRKSPILVLLALFILAPASFAQGDEPEGYVLEHWKKFAAKGWHKIDYSAEVLSKDRIAALDKEPEEEFEEPVSELALLRGVIFGKRGRIFKDQRIQGFLKRQSWYRPDPGFSNSVLTKNERKNLDLVRFAEAEKRPYVAPGDLRYWTEKKIPEDRLTYATAGEWRIMIAEVEAIHGKRFDNEPWLQNYFEDRYWYEPRTDYSPSALSETERANLEQIIARRNEGRDIEVYVGDMDKFQDAPLTEQLLRGLTLSELRLIRNEFFARNGYRFKFPGIAQHFEWREWYAPLEDQSNVTLNETEKKNVELIELVEKRTRERLATEPIKPEMLEGMFIEDLRVLRNEIFARRGRIFKDEDLQNYFASQDWYKPNPDFKDEMLGQSELENLAVIKQAEEYALSRFDAFEG
ncbi:MAG: YARHG domain-containing protein [Acidobacteria bacterium]|nr:MAG: YARHG domain-containing protein [Acidobacteriota bacterium]REK03961.1 MAG: YARHG domain-containing protein [Acidobacteriota bacterium]REK15123.1 MAG: YARHG domain-containing protein [Acidobacteriota bacterium]REK46213.1 MAG: YARHG domain-containing protein [Acidobacteriota bacterium]